MDRKSKLLAFLLILIVIPATISGIFYFFVLLKPERAIELEINVKRGTAALPQCFYKVELQQGQTYTIRLKGNWLSDLTIQISEYKNMLKGKKSISNSVTEALMIYTAESTGFHYLRLDRTDDNTWSYDLCVYDSYIGPSTAEIIEYDNTFLLFIPLIIVGVLSSIYGVIRITNWGLSEEKIT